MDLYGLVHSKYRPRLIYPVISCDLFDNTLNVIKYMHICDPPMFNLIKLDVSMLMPFDES